MPKTVKEIIVGYGDVPEPPKDMPGVCISGLRSLIMDCNAKDRELDLENPEHLSGKIRIAKYKARMLEILYDRYQVAAKSEVEASIGVDIQLKPVEKPIVETLTSETQPKPAIVLPAPQPEPVEVAERSIA